MTRKIISQERQSPGMQRRKKITEAGETNGSFIICAFQQNYEDDKNKMEETCDKRRENDKCRNSSGGGAEGGV